VLSESHSLGVQLPKALASAMPDLCLGSTDGLAPMGQPARGRGREQSEHPTSHRADSVGTAMQTQGTGAMEWAAEVVGCIWPQ